MFTDSKMKRKPVIYAIVQQWTEEFPDLSYKLKGCIRRHVASKTYSILRDGDKQWQFNIDLFKFMVECSIPWKQLDNPIFCEFIEKCAGGTLWGSTSPGYTTLCQNCLPQVTDNIVSNIRSELESRCI